MAQILPALLLAHCDGRITKGSSASIGSHDGLRALSISPNCQRLASAGNNREVKVWDLRVDVLVETLRGHSAEVVAVLWLDNETLASSGHDFIICIWKHGTVLRRLVHRGSVRDLAMNSAGTLLGSASWDGTVAVWSIGDFSLQHRHKLSGWCYCVAFHPDTMAVAVGLTSGQILVADPATGTILRTLNGHRKSVNRICISVRGDCLVSAAMDNTARIWDWESGTMLFSVDHPYHVLGLAFVRGPDNACRWVVSASDDRAGATKITAVATGLRERTLAAGTAVCAVALREAPWDAISSLRSLCMAHSLRLSKDAVAMCRLPLHVQEEVSLLQSKAQGNR
eukprot:TRINITY_DN3219_c0_g1_i1.p1 TRINITY_DN3219_c0_g1~~TRINITY_DN3219_c0_g1_i1.p1  ORF type:complete len:339 (+),score=48.94 TRINITY_DN3219_c0_g1_i1:3-1019(+)